MVNKTDLTTGKELPGAELVVTDKDGNVIDSWTSTDEGHNVIGLKEGETYTLTETTCPYGYQVAESITFTVSGDKAIQKVEMKDAPILTNIQVLKLDKETNEVIKSNFKFGIYSDPECTNLIKEVQSDKNSGTALFADLRYGEYYIKETKAPSGYKLSSEVVKIEINDKGVFVNGTQLGETDNTYSFNFYNQKLPKIQTGASSLIIPIVLLAISLATGIGTVVYTFIKKKKKQTKTK